MRGKHTIIRGENKLANLDPKIQALFDKKHVEIVRAQEEEEEQASEVVTELIETLTELACQNSDNIEKLAEALNVKIKAEEPEEKIREKITKGLEQVGFDIGMVVKGKRIKIRQ